MNNLTEEEQKKVEELRTAITPHAAVGAPHTFPAAYHWARRPDQLDHSPTLSSKIKRQHRRYSRVQADHAVEGATHA